MSQRLNDSQRLLTAETAIVSTGSNESRVVPGPPPPTASSPERKAYCTHFCGFEGTEAEVLAHMPGCQKAKDLLLCSGGLYFEANGLGCVSGGNRPSQVAAGRRLAEQRLLEEARSNQANGRMSTDNFNLGMDDKDALEFSLENSVLYELENGNLYNPYDPNGPGGRAFPLEGPLEQRAAEEQQSMELQKPVGGAAEGPPPPLLDNGSSPVLRTASGSRVVPLVSPALCVRMESLAEILARQSGELKAYDLSREAETQGAWARGCRENDLLSENPVLGFKGQATV